MTVKMTEKTEKLFGIDHLVNDFGGVEEDPDTQLQRIMAEGRAKLWMEQHPAPAPEEPAEPEDPDAELQRVMADGRARWAAEAIPVYVVNDAPVKIDPIDVKLDNAILTGIGMLVGAGLMTIVWIVSMML